MGPAARQPSRNGKNDPSPAKRVDSPSERPLIRRFHQPGAHRILPNVPPLFLTMDAMTQPRIPKVPLPTSRALDTQTTEPPLPPSNPAGQFNGRILGSAEQVEVVGHEEIADHPGVGCEPAMSEAKLDLALCQPGLPVLGAHGQEDDGRLVRLDIYDMFGLPAPGAGKGVTHGTGFRHPPPVPIARFREGRGGFLRRAGRGD